MTIGIRDKRVIKAFIDQKPAEGHKLWTNGVSLDVHGLGGKDVAVWNMHDLIAFPNMSSRTTEQIQRALMKLAPKSYFVNGRGW